MTPTLLENAREVIHRTKAMHLRDEVVLGDQMLAFALAGALISLRAELVDGAMIEPLMRAIQQGVERNGGPPYDALAGNKHYLDSLRDQAVEVMATISARIGQVEARPATAPADQSATEVDRDG